MLTGAKTYFGRTTELVQQARPKLHIEAVVAKVVRWLFVIVGGYSVVTQDVLPFSNTLSERAIKVFGANRTGLERRGFERDTIENLQTALRLLTRAGLNTSQAVERIRAEIPECPEVEELLAFLGESKRGVIK